MSVSVLAKNVCSVLGEGPFWEKSSKSLLYVDMEKGSIHKWCTVTNTENKVTVGDHVSFVIPRESGGYIIGTGKNLAGFNWDSPSVEKLADIGEEKPGIRFNDGKCDAHGRLWTGTMGPVGTKPDGSLDYELEECSMYRFDQNHELKKFKERVSLSNGIGWTNDNKHMFYADSLAHRIFVFDYDLSAGTITNEKVAVNYLAVGPETGNTTAVPGVPDGLCVDIEDKIWVACFDACQVIRFDPVTGKAIQTIDFPGSLVSSCCFGGENYDELYVTSASSAFHPSFSAGPLAGSVFKVTGLGVKGAPVFTFKG